MVKGRAYLGFSLFSTAAEEKALREIGTIAKLEVAVSGTSETFPVNMKDKSFPCVCT